MTTPWMLVDLTDEKGLKVMRQDKYVWLRPHQSSHLNEEISMLINQSEEPLATENKENENKFWGTTYYN